MSSLLRVVVLVLALTVVGQAAAASPRVRIAAPAQWSAVHGEVAVRIVGAHGRAAVRVRVDGRLVRRATRLPLRFRLDTARLANGRHRIVVRARFPGGAVARASRVVVAQNPRQLLGLHMDLTWDGAARRRRAIAAAERFLHPQVSRNSFLWHLIEPTRGVRDWRRTDAVVRELRSAGIEPLFVVYGSPSWANGVPASASKYYLQVPTADQTFDQWVTEYAEFMRAAARRYRGKVSRWELWNEPNALFWKPAPNVDQYARWYTAVREAILSQEPHAQVAVGGLAGLAAGCCGSGRAFLEGLIARGVPIDDVAIHPYSSRGHAPDVHWRWHDNFDDIQLIRNVLDSHGERDAVLWVTEWGWSSTLVGEAEQARYLATSLRMLRNRYPYVRLATVFMDADRPPTYMAGLLDGDFRPKPAASVFARAVAAERRVGAPPRG